MKYVLAISGGVDSVALLDMFAKRHDPGQLIVAHFDHGIRGKTSETDALFVEKLSQKYRVEFEIAHGNLTKIASEELARTKRYEFLKEVAAKYQAQLVTAHHQDDLVETIAINLRRGTGWRGLAVFGDTSILRPLIGMRKSDIYSYALRHQLEWVEDETNLTNAYLRNRVRQRLGSSLTDRQREKLLHLYKEQALLKEQINQQVKQLRSLSEGSRHFLIMSPPDVAIELLREMTDGKLVRPQLENALLAIKTFKAGSVYEAGGGVLISFTKRGFIVTNTSKML